MFSCQQEEEAVELDQASIQHLNSKLLPELYYNKTCICINLRLKDKKTYINIIIHIHEL